MGKPKNDAERAEMYRRQLGGVNAALDRARQQVKDLQAELDSVKCTRVTDAYVSGMADDLLSEMLEGIGMPDNYRLIELFHTELDSEYGDFATFADIADDAAARAISPLVAKPLAKAAAVSCGITRAVPAHVDYQVWVGDYAHEFDSADFDAGPALAMLDGASLRNLRCGEYDEASDELFRMASTCGLVPRHDGPFSCCVDDAEALDDVRRAVLAHRDAACEQPATR